MIVLMATPKRKPTLRQHLSQRTSMHHIAWGIVCLLLIMCMGGLWVHAQSLSAKATELEKQLLATKRPAPSTCRVNGDWQANTTRTQSIDNRSYLVHLPANFVPYEYYPLLLFYPGKGASAEAAQAAYGLDNLPAIVVYPYPTMSKDGLLAWQGAPYSSDSDDIGFTRSILDKLQAELCVDRTKVYAMGMSNGGGFASLLSCRLPDRFAAYAVVAGAMYSPGGQCTPPQPAPMISIHGDQDPIVPYDGSPLRNLPPVENWAATRARMNGCNKPTTITSGFHTVATIWNDCRDNATVQNIRVEGGGHMWGDVTNDTIWQFLSRFSI